MIVLFNLNSYLGGGEVLLLRIAKEFKAKNIEFCIVSSHEDGYINEEANRLNFNLIKWPCFNDSVIYMNKKDKNKIIDFFNKQFVNYNKLNVFTFCFRDIYNAYVAFTRIENTVVTFSTGIFHPDDTKYLSSYSLQKKKIIKRNKEVLYKYVNYGSVLFMNEANLYSSLDCVNNIHYNIIPLPIPIETSINLRVLAPTINEIRIVWVGRFVNFKYSSIIMMLNFIKDNPNFHLTLIGYGNYKQRIEKYIKKRNIQNIDIIGPVSPNELDQLIDKSHIGYCMGTSILETAKLGIPTLIAPILSPKYHKSSYEQKCLGIFGENSEFNLGERITKNESEFRSIKMCIDKILNNYESYSKLTINHVQKFELGIISNQYFKLITDSKLQFKKDEIALSKPPIIKYVAKKIFYSLKKITNTIVRRQL